MDSVSTGSGIGGEKTLYGVKGDPISNAFSEEPFNHTWPLDWFSQCWFRYTWENEQGHDLFFTVDGKSTGVRLDGGVFRTAFLPWEIEYMLEDTGRDTVPSQDFRTLVGNILEWFETKRETGIEGPDVSLIPQDIVLLQNYPNPFNLRTMIPYRISSPSPVRVILRVYNVLGQEVEVLVNSQNEPGVHMVTWNGDDASSGVYFYRINVGDFTATRRMVLMK